MAPSTAPEGVLKKRKRDEAWAAVKAANASAAKTKAKSDRAEIFKRAETYAKVRPQAPPQPRAGAPPR